MDLKQQRKLDIQAACFAKKIISNGKRIFSLKLFIFNKCQGNNSSNKTCFMHVEISYVKLAKSDTLKD